MVLFFFYVLVNPKILKGVIKMFIDLLLDLLSFLGVLVVCTLITIVGVIFCVLVGGVITAMIGAFKKKDGEDNDNGSNT